MPFGGVMVLKEKLQSVKVKEIIKQLPQPLFY